MTKRKDLLKLLARTARQQGLTFENGGRKGSNHEIWKLDGLTIPIPRH